MLIPILLSWAISGCQKDECYQAYKTDNYQDVLKLCTDPCRSNDSKSCYYLGFLYSTGHGVKQDYSQAKYYFEKSCIQNEGMGCFQLGRLFYLGFGVPKNYDSALPYFRKGCNLDDGDSCWAVSTYDIDRRENLEKACALNSNIGCYYLADLYQYSSDLPITKETARTYYEKSCSLKYGDGCLKLAKFYNDGQMVRQNKATAKEYYGKACDYGEKTGCDDYRKLNEQGY